MFALLVLGVTLVSAANAQSPPTYSGQPTQAYPQPTGSGNYSPTSAQYNPGFAQPIGSSGQPQMPMNRPYQQSAQSLQPMPAQGMPGYAPMPAGYPMYPGTEAQKAAASVNMPIGQWFSHYDQIRHQAQMSPAERQHADQLMSRGLSILVPGDEKQATKNLLNSLVARYQRACQELRALPQINQTANLHQSYFQYFAAAGQLFGDYVRVQDNIFVSDPSTGKPLAAGLLQRKQMLEALEHQCKQLDAQTRAQYGMPPYPW
jgi:hypothetical protein